MKPPYFIEFHSSYGHAFLPISYPSAQLAIEEAEKLQRLVQDDAYYCVSNKNQELVWPPRNWMPPFLPFAYEK